MLIPVIVNSQIVGYSASKISAADATTVEKNNLEFETSFSYLLAKSYNNSKTAFRITYGLTNFSEVGILMPVDLSDISLASKFVFLKKDNFKIGGLLGLNIEQNKHNKCQTWYGWGLLTTIDLSEKISLDLNFHNLFKSQKFYVFITDLGYRLGDYIFLLGFENIFQNNNYQLTLSPGISVETGKRYLIVLSHGFVLSSSLKRQFNKVGLTIGYFNLRKFFWYALIDLN